MYEINRAAVIGAGTMGLGIAGQLANAGVDVLLLDIPAEGDNRNAHGERAIERFLDESQPGLTHKDNLKRITIGNVEDDLNRLVDADWIAEAIVERLERTWHLEISELAPDPVTTRAHSGLHRAPPTTWA